MGKKKKVIQLLKGRRKKEQEKSFMQFSGLQLNAVLLFVLADTFFVQGVVRYLELTNTMAFVRTWLLLILISLFLFVVSVVLITMSNIINLTSLKRRINMVGFLFFVFGVILFLSSLFFLIMII